MNYATIANGETLSGAVNLSKPREYILVQTPEVLTSCTLSLEASLDGVTYYPWGISQTTATTTGSLTTSFLGGGIQYIKIKSSVQQGADRVFQIMGVKTR